MSIDRCDCCEEFIDTDIEDLYHIGYSLAPSSKGAYKKVIINKHNNNFIAKICEICWDNTEIVDEQSN